MGVFGRGGLNIVITIILSRLLMPADFGLLALLWVFSTLSRVLIECGFSQALIRDNEISDTKYFSVFAVNMVIALVIYIVLFFMTPFICRYYNAEEHIWMARVLFLTIPIEAAGIIQITSLSKSMNFKVLAAAECFAALIAGIVAVIMAVLGCGCWSLTVNFLLNSVVMTLILWLRGGWKFVFSFRFSVIKEYFPFSINLLLAGFWDRLMCNLESLLIGRYYSKSDLSFFARARELDAWTSQKLVSAIVMVTYPALAQIRSDKKRFSHACREIIGVTFFVNTCLMLFFIAAAPKIVLLLFGEAWKGTEIYMVPWCLYGIFFPLQSICKNIFQAYGKTRLFLYLSFSRQILRIIVIVMTVQISIICMTWAIIGVAVLGVCLTGWFAARVMQTSLLQILWDSRITFLSAAAGYFSAKWIDVLVPTDNLIPALLLQGVVMAGAYFLTSIVLKNTYLHAVFYRILPELIKKMS